MIRFYVCTPCVNYYGSESDALRPGNGCRSRLSRYEFLGKVSIYPLKKCAKKLGCTGFEPMTSWVFLGRFVKRCETSSQVRVGECNRLVSTTSENHSCVEWCSIIK
jgi:hypothetical protein